LVIFAALEMTEKFQGEGTRVRKSAEDNGKTGNQPPLKARTEQAKEGKIQICHERRKKKH